MVDVFTAGGIIVDNVVAADGRLGPQTMGGNAVYSAAGARLWLDGVGIVGRVPANYPVRFLERLAAAGVDTRGIVTVDESVDEAEWFFYRADGSRADHLHAAMENGSEFAPGSVLSPAQREDLERRLKAAPTKGSDFGSFRRRNPVLTEDVPAGYLTARGAHLAANRPDRQTGMAAALRGRGLVVSVDPGSNAPQLAAGGLDELLRVVSAFLPSERELAVLAPDLPVGEALRRLGGPGGSVCAVKLGARGSMLLSPDGGAWTIPVAATSAIDPTGAGDAYCGGFLAGMTMLGDPLAAACLGTVSASFAVEDFGPFHLLAAGRPAARERLAALAETLDPALRLRLHPLLSRLEAQ